MQTYSIRLDSFEGPLDVLLHLIEKHQIDIYDIPIAIVTEQYLQWLSAMEEFNIDMASEFLVMAATLLQIKSRMLLPKPPKTEDDLPEEDPRQELVDRLIEYRKFKQMSLWLEENSRDRSRFFARLPQVFDSVIPLPEGVSLDDLLKAFAAVWESAIDDYALVAREEISVQEKMADILHILRHHGGCVEFRQTVIRTKSKRETIAAFLALLELIRLQRIDIRQSGVCGPIYLELKASDSECFSVT